MKRLLQLEFLKLYNYKTARRFILFYFVLLALMGFVVTMIKPGVGGITIDLARYGAYVFPYVWQNVTYFADFGSIFLAIIIITNITNEYTNRTLKQNLIDGLSKREFLISKLLTAFSFAALSSIILFFVCLGLGLYYTSNPQSIFTGVEFIFGYFLKLSVFFSLCTLVALWMRKSGIAFMMVIILRLAEYLIFVIELWVHSGSTNGFLISDYTPAIVASRLLPFAKIRFEGMMRGGDVFSRGSVSEIDCVITIIYIFVFIILSYRILKNRDL